MTLVTAEFATIQGRVYDELYSISASRASDEKRLSAIEKLSVDLIAVRDKLLAVGLLVKPNAAAADSFSD